ncbi:MAG TPA: hypothetical protein VNL35_20725, partial [Chloroflexota bacterium]|nr:hypothetical protein [Chloroflexota bacterium]
GLVACLTLVLSVGVFSIVGNPGWHTASDAPASQPSPATAAPNHSATPVRATCANQSGRALASCLGVSFLLLPTILADEQYERYQQMAAIRPSKLVIRPPLPLERHSPTPAVSHVVTEGGATYGVNSQAQHGSVPM